VTLIAAMCVGADCIDDIDMLRAGGFDRLFRGIYAPSTLGSFLRSFTHGHVRQLQAAARRFAANLIPHAGLVPPGEPIVFLDIDSKVKQVYGPAKQGASFGYTKVRGLHSQIETASTPRSRPVVVATRLRKGSAGSGKDVSQSTVSRVIGPLTPLVRAATADCVPDDAQVTAVIANRIVLADGTLAPVWSRRGHRELFSGKHRRTGFNLQPVTDAHGRPITVRGPLPGCAHNLRALRESAARERSAPTADRRGLRPRRPRVSRHRPLHPTAQTGRRATNRPAARVQQAHQRHPRPRRTHRGEPEDVTHPAHRLPPTPAHPRRHATRHTPHSTCTGSPQHNILHKPLCLR
jgi:hypothetical protein